MSMPAQRSTPTDSTLFEHTSVMLEEVLRALAPIRAGHYLDVTLGGAGHARAILEADAEARLLGFDRDPLAVRVARERLAPFGERAQVAHGSFVDVEPWLESAGIEAVSGIVADLGLSSQQLAAAERGMSFRSEGPLDMRMDPTCGETALELIQRSKQEDLADIIYELGEERRSRRVARCIKQAEERGELQSTLDLRRAVVRAVGPRRIGGIDPATRTFQALRIAVNGELEQLRQLLQGAERWLRPGGTLIIISFHSLEDRMVKRAFQHKEIWERLSTKPQKAGPEECARNPRSRSAKLRAARRVVEASA